MGAIGCEQISTETSPPRPTTGWRFNQPGDHQVTAPAICVITRFGLRNVIQLIATYLDYRRLKRDIELSPDSGLIRSAFLVENLRTCYSLSIWQDRKAIARFGSQIPRHVDAARRVLNRLDNGTDGRPQLWSTKWQLISVSNNLAWGDWDFLSRFNLSEAPFQ